MPDITDINGVALSGLTDINGVAKANITDINGVSIPTAGGAEINFADITITVENARFDTSDTYTADLPSSAGAGDFVMIIFGWDCDQGSGQSASNNKVNTPTGYTSQLHHGNSNSDNHIHVYTRLFDGTEGSTVDFSPTSNQGSKGGVFFTFICENIDTSDPIGNIGRTADGSGTEIIMPNVTSVNAGTFINLAGFDGADGDPATFSNPSFTIIEGGQQDSPNSSSNSTHVTTVWGYAHIDASTATDNSVIDFAKSDGKIGATFTLNKA